MGYYSIYLIIKDIIRTITRKKNIKLFIFISIIIIFLFIFKNKTFAYDTIDFNAYGVTDTITIPDYISEHYNYALMLTNYYNNSNNNYCAVLMVSKGDISMTFNGNYCYWRSNDGIAFLNSWSQWSNSGFHNSSSLSSCLTYLKNALSQAPTLTDESQWWQANGVGLVGFQNQSNVTFYGNCDIYDSNGEVLYYSNIGPSIVYPAITTSQTDIENLSFEYLSIDTNTFYEQRVYLYVYDHTNINLDDVDYVPPQKTILLVQNGEYYKAELSVNNSTFWVPIQDLGLHFRQNGVYSFRFVLGTYFEEDGYEYETLEFLTDYETYYLSSNVSSTTISNTNNFIDSQQMTEQTNALNQLVSNDYNENQPNDTLSNISSSTDSIDNTAYVGLFTAIFNKLSVIINGNYNTVEEISYPIMRTNQTITVRSDILSSKIQNTFIYTFLQLFWYYLFGMYIFKFSNNIIIKIKSGEILNGYENKNEVITSNML